jgi:cytochrome P450
MTLQQPAPQASDAAASPAAAGCPFHHGAGDHSAPAHQKTAKVVEPAGPLLERDAAGVWQVRSHAVARQILRGEATRQAGFKAELIEQTQNTMRSPILYLEGKDHHEQRKHTARFFTPKMVDSKYRELMDRLTDQIIGKLLVRRHADLSLVAMEMAVGVAGAVVGLTSSLLPGMDGRLNSFFAHAAAPAVGFFGKLTSLLGNSFGVAAFYYLDVLPAIRARRKQPQDDVISHLIQHGYKNPEILTECITYGAAGMVTTREFITVATWHLLEKPELRARYLAAPEAERYAMLEEILRIEPVVGALYRRALEDIPLETPDGPVTIPKGDLITLNIYAANADPALVGERPRDICPGRALTDKKTSPSVMAFGDGHHRCPGQFLAIQESDVFLRRLLSLPGLTLEQPPRLTWNDMIASYELRDCMISVA